MSVQIIETVMTGSGFPSIVLSLRFFMWETVTTFIKKRELKVARMANAVIRSYILVALGACNNGTAGYPAYKQIKRQNKTSRSIPSKQYKGTQAIARQRSHYCRTQSIRQVLGPHL